MFKIIYYRNNRTDETKCIFPTLEFAISNANKVSFDSFPNKYEIANENGEILYQRVLKGE